MEQAVGVLPKKRERREKRKQIKEVIQQSVDAKDKENRPRYYYLRDEEEHKPIVTVCEVGYKGKMYRGLSICSYMDNPQKSIGRNIALDRAIAAIITGTNLFPVARQEAMCELDAANVDLDVDDQGNLIGEFYKAEVSPFKNSGKLIDAYNSGAYKVVKTE